MICTVKRAGELGEKPWSGGVTTELYIYPEGADYAARRFAFRLSTALVTDPASTFTPLPGITRHIMPLEGDLTLDHLGQRNVTLSPGECDVFPGSWTTRSTGRCRDFNLMLAPGWGGCLRCVRETGEILLDRPFTALYTRRGGLPVTVSSPGAPPRSAELDTGDFLLVRLDEGETARLTVSGPEDAPLDQVVLAQVWPE